VNQKQPMHNTDDAATNTPPLDSRRHQEALLDQAVADSFPASDPIAPAVQARLEPADVSMTTNLPTTVPASGAGSCRRRRR
jgi:hypothetical protein